MTSPILRSPRMTVNLTSDDPNPPALGGPTANGSPPGNGKVSGAPSPTPAGSGGGDGNTAAAAGTRLYNTSGGTHGGGKAKQDGGPGATDVSISARHHVVTSAFAGEAGPSALVGRAPGSMREAGSAGSSAAVSVCGGGGGDLGPTGSGAWRGPAVPVPAVPAAAANGGGGVAWRCGLCSYYALAMDGKGGALPFSSSAFGVLLPMRCPRCQLEHTSWTAATPFDAFGRHANLRGGRAPHTAGKKAGEVSPPDDGLAAELLAGAGGVGPAAWQPSGAPTTGAPLGGGGKECGPRRGREKRLCYYCSKCNRRLLRVDAEGELVAMSTDANGVVQPITCPGCKETHNQWCLRSFFSPS